VEEPGQEGSAPLDQALRSQSAAPPAETLRGGPAAPINPYSNSAVEDRAQQLRTIAAETVAACQWLSDKQARDPAADVAATARVLAALVRRFAGRMGVRLENAKEPQLRRMCENRRSDTALIKAAAAALGWSAADLAADEARLKQAEELIGEFKQAIGEDKGLSLAVSPDELGNRMVTFADNRSRTDDQVRANLEAVIEKEWPRIARFLLEPAAKRRKTKGKKEPRRQDRQKQQQKTRWIAECVATLPPARLRTCPDNLLADIAVNFAEWHTLVQYLEIRAQFPQAADPRMEDALKTCIEDVTDAVLANFKGQENLRPLIEEAVSQTVSDTLEHISDPCRGYQYEGGLTGWVTAGAKHLVLAMLPEIPLQEPDPDDDGRRAPLTQLPARPAQVPAVEQRDSAVSEQERYRIVLTYFKGDSYERAAGLVAIIQEYAAIIPDEPEAESPAEARPPAADNPDTELTPEAREQAANEPDTEPAPDDLQETAGEPGNSTEAGTRRRLRQRRAVLDYVREEVPGGAPDEPGDRSVLDWVAREHGIHPVDVSTIRGLANLIRAACADGILTWVYLARLFVDKAWAISRIQEEGRLLIDGWLGVHTGEREQMLRRLDAMGEQMRRSRSNGGLARVLRATSCRFLVAPCWYLKVDRGKTLDEVCHILKPAAHERAALKEIYEGL